MWTDLQIQQHKKAATLLDKIMQQTFNYLREYADHLTEFEVQNYFVKKFNSNNLITHDRPIVAFGKNTQHVHYFPNERSAAKLIPKSLIMIDIWARLNEPQVPFADITWVGYFGNNHDQKKLKNFQLVLQARNEAIKYLKDCLIKKYLPTGQEVDKIARDFLMRHSLADNFLHGLGHPLGFVSAHGRKGVYLKPSKSCKHLEINIGYTIEPGIYFEKDYGMRSEINFYIDENYELNITTPPQIDIKYLNI